MSDEQTEIFKRDEVIALINDHISGKIRTLRELRNSIQRFADERILIRNIRQQVDFIKESNALDDRSDDESSKKMISKNSAVETRAAKREMRRTLHRNLPEPKRARMGLTNEAAFKTIKQGSLRSVKQKETEEPSSWDRRTEEKVRREALMSVEQVADDPMGKAKSKVWLFCDKIDGNGNDSKAKCKICGMVMVRKLGSTRAMLRHLRKMHGNMIDGIIRPVTKRITTIAGKPRVSDNFDIDDDSAWVEEVEEEEWDDGDVSEHGAKVIKYSDHSKSEPIEYADFADSECPEYVDEVYIDDNGSYIEDESDEFVDVVYVQDETSLSHCAPKEQNEAGHVKTENGESTYLGPCVSSMPFTRLRRALSESDCIPYIGSDCIAMNAESSNLNESNTCRYQNMVPTSHESDSLIVDRIDGNQGIDSINDTTDDDFGRSVAFALKAFAPVDRIHVRSTIMQCIVEMNRKFHVDST